MKQALIGLMLFAAGAALATWWAGNRADTRTDTETGAPSATAPAPAPANANANANANAHAPAAGTAARRYALQAWEGCRPLQAGDAFTGPVTRTLSLSDGSSVEVSLVPATRENGSLVFDTLVKATGSSSRSQTSFQSPLLVDGVLMRPVDLDQVSRDVSGAAAYLDGPHPMAD
ncbi:hypothetical protein [Lysobacter sp. A3-1-A15]|uniref:hypothetical protein n=1 Tax=Novilysobacter viscosus TaxID=3098602 RepID=UPI002ED91EB2